jgi:hypothetical protein
MAKKIKALRTINGSYGHLVEGAEAVVNSTLANELASAGLAEIVTDDEAEPEEKPHKEVSVTVSEVTETGVKPRKYKK